MPYATSATDASLSLTNSKQQFPQDAAAAAAGYKGCSHPATIVLHQTALDVKISSLKDQKSNYHLNSNHYLVYVNRAKCCIA